MYQACQPKEPDCCFELLGFDIMLDSNARPWLLEVNHTPSFHCDSPIDSEVKERLLKDTLDILQLSVESRKAKESDLRREKQELQQSAQKRMTVREQSDKARFDYALIAQSLPENGFRLIYPLPQNEEKYGDLITKAHKLWMK